jgi:hypothetical protein
VDLGHVQIDVRLGVRHREDGYRLGSPSVGIAYNQTLFRSDQDITSQERNARIFCEECLLLTFIVLDLSKNKLRFQKAID